MHTLVLYAVVLFTTALVFYTVGVWSERFARRLKAWHVVAFSLGVITDALGTWLMFKNLGYIKFTPHTISGFIGFFLMVFHFLWATKVITTNDEKRITNFHRFSVFVWSIWMVSCFSGLILGIQRLA
ncbi:MAG TPA: TIGR03987 family protein [Chromatiales bacterium]|nr:TIGR03987 family protein [Thiotrichales bacterium]HIP67779.1 TIGR03987 family protein [Chromatiales bacterium]